MQGREGTGYAQKSKTKRRGKDQVSNNMEI